MIPRRRRFLQLQLKSWDGPSPLNAHHQDGCKGYFLRNLLTDISGVRVGHADDKTVASGATAVIFDRPAVGAVDVRGGGPRIRGGALLRPSNTPERVHAPLLAGGSAVRPEGRRRGRALAAPPCAR